MGEGVALAGRGQQHRARGIVFEIGGVGGELGDQNQRRAVDVGGDVNQRGERMAGVAVDRRERARAGRPNSAFATAVASNRRPARAFRQAIRHEARQ